MTIEDRINNYINTHPKECLRLLLIIIGLIWQSMACVIGIIAYLILSKMKYKTWQICAIGCFIWIVSILFQQNGHFNMMAYIQQGFLENKLFWKLLSHGKISIDWNTVLGAPLLIASFLSLIDLIPNHPHEKTLKELQSGSYQIKQEIDDASIEKALKKIKEENHDGTILGVSKYTGDYVVIPDRYINQVMLVLGTTGSGKTITLRRFYQRAIKKGYPLIIVDGKPDDENIAYIKNLADQNHRKFFGFNCANFLPYDPLANGGYTELKDKIISLKDEWSSDHYRSIAEDYLQATFEVLLKSGKPFDLKKVVYYLDHENLSVLVRETNDPHLMKRVSTLEGYDKSDITGLQAHLNILIHSELGKFFEKNEKTFTLLDVINQNGVVYFALPALRFPSFSKVLGKLVINDLNGKPLVF